MSKNGTGGNQALLKHNGTDANVWYLTWAQGSVQCAVTTKAANSFGVRTFLSFGLGILMVISLFLL